MPGGSGTLAVKPLWRCYHGRPPNARPPPCGAVVCENNRSAHAEHHRPSLYYSASRPIRSHPTDMTIGQVAAELVFPSRVTETRARDLMAWTVGSQTGRAPRGRIGVDDEDQAAVDTTACRKPEMAWRGSPGETGVCVSCWASTSLIGREASQRSTPGFKERQRPLRACMSLSGRKPGSGRTSGPTNGGSVPPGRARGDHLPGRDLYVVQ